MKSIIHYLTDTYQPDAIILYGSYADCTNNADSDFDCLVVSRNRGLRHDTSIINNVTLDAFIYSPEEIRRADNLDEFLQICDGIILKDTDGLAFSLQHKVQTYLAELPGRSPEELHDSVAWCEKMFLRTMHSDAEGYFRWHWLLRDSLEIYCDLKGISYSGPKKSIRFMQRTDATGYSLYSDALARFEQDALRQWIEYLRLLLP